MATNPFESSAFKQGLTDIQNRVNNSKTVTQRIGLGDTSNTPGVSSASAAQNTSFNNTNAAMANNPVFQAGQRVLDRNFTEDSRRFDVSTSAKSTALANEQSTIRYQSDNSLTGVKYNADTELKGIGLQTNAQMYGADRNLDGIRYSADSNLAGTRLQADAQRYGADRGFEASIYGADRNVDQARIGADAQVRSSEIGADASRFNALLATGSSFFNSSQYRPTFNR